MLPPYLHWSLKSMPIRDNQKLRIIPATKDIVRNFYGRPGYWRHEIKDIFCAEFEGKIIAIAGVWRDPTTYGSIFDEYVGRWIAFLDAKPEAKRAGVAIIREINAYLRTFKGELCAHHDSRFPTAERIMTILKFRPTDEFVANPYEQGKKLRVWKRWQE